MNSERAIWLTTLYSESLSNPVPTTCSTASLATRLMPVCPRSGVFVSRSVFVSEMLSDSPDIVDGDEIERPVLSLV